MLSHLTKSASYLSTPNSGTYGAKNEVKKPLCWFFIYLPYTYFLYPFMSFSASKDKKPFSACYEHKNYEVTSLKSNSSTVRHLQQEEHHQQHHHHHQAQTENNKNCSSSFFIKKYRNYWNDSNRTSG